MAYGLKIWDSTGTNVRLDTTDRVARYVSHHTGTLSNGSSTTVVVSGLANDGTWEMLCESDGAGVTKLKGTVSSGSFTVSHIASSVLTADLTWYVTLFKA